jgi:uncharacterized protein YndB with AHSA1/START domain
MLSVARKLGGRVLPEIMHKAGSNTPLAFADTADEMPDHSVREGVMMNSEIEARTFNTERVLRHSPRRVFDAFAQPELLARWWGPSGFTNTFDTFEFRPGGSWKFVMHGPDGSNHPNESVFLTIEAPSTLVIEHVSAPRFVLTVTLSADEAGTLLRWNQEFADAAFAARIRHIVVPANEQNLDRLEAVLS